MNYAVTRETFNSLAAFQAKPGNNLNWKSLFMLPVWMKIWWQELHPAGGMSLLEVKQDGAVIGFAPLIIRDGTAFLMGSADVCDYLDFIVAPGTE